MEFGLCTGPENIPLVKELGYDYIELSACSIAAMTNEEFDALEKTLAEHGLTSKCSSILFPKTMRVIGAQADVQQIQAYLDGVLYRLSRIGCRTVVFGSGKSRMMDDGQPLAQAAAQLVDVTRRIARTAAGFDMMCALEPVNDGESNMINTVYEASIICAWAGCDNLYPLADLFHMLCANEKASHIVLAKRLAHAHISTSHGRGFPLAVEDEITQFFDALSTIGYDITMSIEGKTDNLERDAAAALKILRGYEARFAEKTAKGNIQ